MASDSRVPGTQPAGAVEIAAGAEPSAEAGRVHLLLVDDHPENLMALEAILKDLGHTLVRATSGREALKHLLDREFALILLDVRMPDMDGYETAAMVRKREQTRNLPIIFLTAMDVTPAHLSRGYAVGAVDYLFKPVNPDILRFKVKAFVDLFVKNQQLKDQAERLRQLENEEHERRMEELRVQRNRFFTLPHDMMCILDPAGNLRELNPAWERDLGYPSRDLAGRPLVSLVHPDDRETFRSRWKELKSGRGLLTFEARSFTRTGETKWLSFTLIGFPREDVYYAVARDVTGRIRSERQLNDFFEHSTLAFHWTGPDGTILRANRAELAMMGYSAEEYVGRSILDFHADRADIEDLLRRIQAGEIVTDHPARLRARDGSIREVLIDKSGYWEDGRFIHSNCFTRDVTAQRQAERRQATQYDLTRILSESQSYEDAAPRILKSVCEGLGWDVGAAWFAQKSGDLRCIHFWRKPERDVADFEKVTREEAFAPGTGLPGRVWAGRVPVWIPDLLADANFPRAPQAGRSGLRSGFAVPIALEGESLGVLEFFSAESRARDEEMLNLLGALGSQIGQYMERKRAEGALTRHATHVIRNQAALLELATMDGSDLEASFRRITALSALTLGVDRVGVWMFTDDHAAIVCRDLYLRRSDAHESGLRLDVADYPRYFESILASRVTAAADAWNDPRMSEFGESYLKPHKIVSMMDVGVRLQGKLAGIVCHEHSERRDWTLEEQEFASSIADRVSLCLAAADRARSEEDIRRLNAGLEEKVRERTSQLQEANQEVESFAYSVSHDLRAPLRAMHGLSQALLEDYAASLDETGRDYARRIMESTRRMDALIQDLLAYSRLTRVDIKCDRVDLATLVGQVLKDMDPELRERGAEVRVEEPLPAVLGHGLTLTQVLINLISNAIKFVAPGVEPVVRIRAEARDRAVRLWVEDNGIGIEAQHHERIFRVFERLNRAEDYPGTGIGLAIVRKAMGRMRGQAGVDSGPGRGSRFWIELPTGE